jgi:hypothetical protein
MHGGRDDVLTPVPALAVDPLLDPPPDVDTPPTDP